MKVAVTGATGFLGPNVVRRLVERGHTVRVLARDPKKVEAKLPAAVTTARFDASSPLAPEALAGVEAVVNLAGENVAQKWTPENRKRIRDSRVQGTHLLVEAMKAAGTVKHLISASAVGYYGFSRGSEPLTEESSQGTGFLAELNRDWEAEAQAAQAAGIRTVIPRIGLVMHPTGGVLSQLLPLYRLGLGGRVGTGEQYMSWIHLEDLMELFFFLLEKPELAGVLNATAPEPVTQVQFAKTLGQVLRRPTFMVTPAFLMKAAMGEAAELVLQGQRVLPKRTQEVGFTFRYPELQGALRAMLS
jgi:uncharacterized protein (TIGR01777 family)